MCPRARGSYSLAKSARTTYAAATKATATASGGRRSDLAAGAEGAESAFAIIVAQRFAGLFASSFFASFTASSTRCR